MTSDLVSGSWQGAASAAMGAVATQYSQWLSTAASHAATAATHAKAIAGVFEAAKAAVTHPAAVVANRTQLVSLVRSNLLGFNAPAIAATEGAYEAMWAKNVTALAGYHGAASAVAEQLTSSQQALQPLPGLAGQAAGSAAASPAGVSPSQLATILQGIASEDKKAIQNLIGENKSTFAGARTLIRKDLNSAGTALSAGKLGDAGACVLGAGLVSTGLPVAVGSEDLGSVGELLGFDLVELGESIIP